ncbi:hypothetical protein JQK88_05675 [Mesorhizobium caraganae]|uniref:hypothetical protein n=1 Tax=Mesorhizobium caraganae TaxID=483206 RepID=UPI001939FF10|nr:hypothetical protein [Mesorhizobium caraganae]MBM2710737.1 hypothetical protein [Mesorhizobium caraganae]
MTEGGSCATVSRTGSQPPSRARRVAARETISSIMATHGGVAAVLEAPVIRALADIVVAEAGGEQRQLRTEIVAEDNDQILAVETRLGRRHGLLAGFRRVLRPTADRDALEPASHPPMPICNFMIQIIV